MLYELANFLNYKGINEFSYYEAYEDMTYAENALYPTLGIKKLFFSIFFNGKTPNAMAMPKYGHSFKKFDLLNENKSEWANCVTNEKRSESFEELYLNASKEVKTLNDILEKSLNENVLNEKRCRFARQIGKKKI